jgi:hypothetical protein
LGGDAAPGNIKNNPCHECFEAERV